MTDRDELRELIREVIRDQLVAIRAAESVETVNLSSDAELAAFVARLLELDPGERDDLRAGRKRFRLAAVPAPGPAVRRIERGAVTEAMIRDAARAGQRLVLGRGAVLTPLARDRARTSGVTIEKER
jgi:hypothetical protein